MSKWRVVPKIHFVNFRKEYPNMGRGCFTKWFEVTRYWGGRIININIKSFTIVFDFRRNWVVDMVSE
jgi:hypothetical protein